VPPPPQSRMLPSILDRLRDPDSMGSVSSPGYDERKMFDAVRADLEQLLNARLSLYNVPKEFPELARSIATYGLPDLSRYNGTSPAEVAELRAVVLGVIARNEPRLKNVRVKIARGKEHGSVAVRFQIDAELNVDPAPEVGFVTVVELSTGRAVVSAGDGGRP
jgi:type VI secretion system protein ImpF